MIVSGSGRQRGICVISVHTISSLPPPYYSFLRTPRPVQFENGNPLFHLKLGSLAIILRTAVGAKFDYSAARTKVWVSAEDLDSQGRSLCLPDKRPTAL